MLRINKQNKTAQTQVNVCVLLLFILSSHSIFPQQMKFERIGVENGLSQSAIMSIIQDREGFMWFGTWNGLNRYDGQKFIQFRKNQNDTLSLSTNHVVALIEDHEGSLWASTALGGICRYDKRTGKFLRIGNAEKNRQYNQNQFIEDKNGVIWGVSGRAIIKYDLNSKNIVYLPIRQNQLGINTLIDSKNQVWFIFSTSLARVNPQSGTLQYIDAPAAELKLDKSEKHFTCGIEVSEGIIWLGTSGNGIVEFNVKSGKFKKLIDKKSNGQKLSDDYVVKIARDHQGYFWIATQNGLNRILTTNHSQPQIAEAAAFFNEKTNNSSLSSNSIYSLFEDRTGNLWIGTNLGLNKLPPQLKKFKTISNNPSTGNPIAERLPVCFMKDDDGLLWVGTTTGLAYINLAGFIPPKYKLIADKLANTGVFVILQDKNKRIWLGTKKGLYSFDKSTGKLSYINLLANEHHHPSDCQIYSITEDNNGVLWIGAQGGLIKYIPAENIWKRYIDKGESSSTKRTPLLSVQSVDDYILCGSDGEGLFRFYPKTEKYDSFFPNEKDSLSLPHIKVIDVFQDSRHRIWVATLGGGIAQMHEKEGKTIFNVINTKNGLPNDFVYGILEDKSGCLWISTDKGLAKINSDNNSVQVYNVHDGLPTDEFMQNAFYMDTEGTFYFGSIKGIVTFKPEEIKLNTVPPNIAVTDFKVFNESLKEHIYDSVIILNYNQNYFSFDFIALSFGNTSNLKYAYRLEGLQEKWINCSSGEPASFTNVPPGEYVFHVIGSNEDGVWNTEGKKIRLSIIPPFWATTWFRVVSLLVVLLITLAIIRYYTNKKYMTRILALENERAVVRQLQSVRDKIARDLHDELASTVSSASLFLATAKMNINQPGNETEKFLDMSSELLSEAEESISDIVWTVSPKNSDLANLISRVRLSATDMCRAKGIECEINEIGDSIKVEIQLPDNIRRNLYLVCKESLSNALKHSGANKIIITFERSFESLIYRISDNGKGFDENELTEKLGGNGIINMRKRSEEINGEFTVNSSPGKGSTIALKLNSPFGLLHK